MTILLILGLVLLTILTVRLFGSRRKRSVKAVLTVLYLLLMLLCGMLLYFSVYYRAAEDAKAVLPRETLRLGGLHAWYFDGPGEDTALVFYPGAKVEAASYAPLLAKLADGGVDCFLVEMPLRFAFFGVSAAQRVMEVYQYDHWILAGHSLGGVAASIYTAAHPENVDGLVMLASYPAKELRDVPYLSVLADNDGVLDREDYEKSRALWPDGAEELVISGGSHAQFGSYGLQRGDGEASISPDEQRTQTAEAVLAWIQTHTAEGSEAA